MRPDHPAAAAAFRAVAGTFGEAVRIVPLVASEYTDASPDPERGPMDTRATVAITPSVDPIDGSRGGTGRINTTTRLATRRASIWFPPEVYSDIGYGLRSGDRIVLVDRPGEPSYTVSREPVFSDRGDVSIHLVQEGGGE